MRAARGLGRAASALAILGLALAVPPATALADCQMAPPLEQAISSSDLVFVGTVTAVASGGRSASVRVEDVWRGGEIPAAVTVLGGTDPAQAMEDDRTFEAGVRYLFFPVVVDGQMVDNICTATVPWVDDFAAVRPVDAHSPVPAAAEPAPGLPSAMADVALPLLTALVIGGAALAIAVVVARRRAA